MNVLDSHVTCLPLRTAPVEQITTEVCVVGGGLSGVCAAISAARSGVRVTLIQDRPVLGGNASSEIRMWICGAHGRFNKEAGLLEEIQLLNQFRNPELKYSVWDTVLYEKVKAEPNITLILNCSVCEVGAEGGSIQSVRSWHLTRQCWIEVRGNQFIDCSGDSILRLSGASHRWGREDCDAYAESLGLTRSDRKTMGNSILLQLREIDPENHRPFAPPSFAVKLDDRHPRSNRFYPKGHNFWWLEVGGEMDTIKDSDTIRDELYGIAFGVWDYIKNHPDGRGYAWELEWIGALPGKRENVRYLGDYTLCQKDIESRGQFDDIVAYGGWTMDDHPPAAFFHDGMPTEHHEAPSPYGIPYRCLYSHNISNLLFAGRNISASHLALSSTRVMATCSMLGQAAGTAAAMSVQKGVAPREIGQKYITELQNRLMYEDQWLPGHQRVLTEEVKRAEVTGRGVLGELSCLFDGHERRLSDGDHWIEVEAGGYVELAWEDAVTLKLVRMVVNTGLHVGKRMPCSYPKKGWAVAMPPKMPKTISVQVRMGDEWKEVHRVQHNIRRLIQLPLDGVFHGLRVRVEEAWGGGRSGIFSIEVGEPDYSAEVHRVEWPEVVMTGGDGTA